MSSLNQNTLGGEVTLEGIGVHSGEAATLTMRPAEAGRGIRFRRTDVDGDPEVPADLDHVVSTDLGTTLGVDDVHVLTVEHVMAALAAHGIDNATLDLSGPELPIRDGSFRDYFRAVADVGVREQDAETTTVELSRPLVLTVEKGESYTVSPDSELTVSATIDFTHPAIGRQFGSFRIQDFEEELSAARTFGFRSDAEALQARGLARGASLDNTVVLDDDGVMNEELRFPDEYVRHKAGDIIGDLALLGGRLRGHVVAERPSHRGNVELARAIRERTRDEGPAIVDVAKIMQYLPHRYPMLLVDRVTHFESGRRITGIKNVTINEPFFQGHFPGHPIMPGVLIIEAMAQVGGLLLMDTVENPEDQVVYFMSLDKVKFRRPVTPGDQIVFDLEVLQIRRMICKLKGVGRVDGRVVAEAELMAQVVER